MTSSFQTFGNNAYLHLAYKALLSARKPLTSLEIIQLAQKDGFMPDHLHGKTQHKTLAARLSVYIRQKSSKAEFYRTAPATYFLTEFKNDPTIPAKYKKIFVGNLRSKTIRKEDVLVISRDVLGENISGEYVPYNEDKFRDLYANHCHFMDRTKAEVDNSVKQFVTFTLVHHKTNLLIYRRGKFTTTSERLKGQLSVGFGGHVNHKDFSLFATGGDALLQNAARELREELFLDEYYDNQEETKNQAELLGYVNVDDSPDAEHHVAVLVAFNHNSSELPTKGEMSINKLEWLDLTHRKNDLSDFDLWSRMILQNIFQGRIKLKGCALNATA